MLVSEDYELCLRLRKNGWILLRIDAEMTLHDMAMTRFGQWWRRSVRSGYGLCRRGILARQASGAAFTCAMSAASSSGGSCSPCSCLGLAWPTSGLSLLSCGGYLLSTGGFGDMHWAADGRVERSALRRFVRLGQVPHGRRDFNLLVRGRLPGVPKPDHRIQGRRQPKAPRAGLELEHIQRLNGHR